VQAESSSVIRKLRRTLRNLGVGSVSAAVVLACIAWVFAPTERTFALRTGARESIAGDGEVIYGTVLDASGHAVSAVVSLCEGDTETRTLIADVVVSVDGTYRLAVSVAAGQYFIHVGDSPGCGSSGSSGLLSIQLSLGEALEINITVLEQLHVYVFVPLPFSPY
jgi:hypothetical protein